MIIKMWGREFIYTILMNYYISKSKRNVQYSITNFSDSVHRFPMEALTETAHYEAGTQIKGSLT